MHKLTTRWRLIAMLGSVAAFVAIIMSSGALAPETNATTNALPRGVSCAEFYLDLDNNGVADSGTDPDDVVALAITRIEPADVNGGAVNTYDLTSVFYLGPVAPTEPPGVIPDAAPDQDCQAATAEASPGPENSDYSSRLDFDNQFGLRPGAAVATFSAKAVPGTLTYRTCGYSDVLGAWIRQDTITTVTATGVGTKSAIDGALYLGTAAPTTLVVGEPHAAADPTECTGGLAFNTVGESHTRTIRTDAALTGKNAGLTADASPAGGDTGDTVDDDWDGDGCTDWDELDKNFVHNYAAPASTNQRGMDPFNPYDCDQNVNGNVSLVVQVIGNKAACTAADIIAGTCVGGAVASYFHCLAGVDHTKSGSPQPLAFDFACYADSRVSVVNSNYDQMNAPETVCSGAADEDGDGAVNDGCAVAGTNGEESACGADIVDDDSDGRVNDGCPANLGAEGSAAGLANIGECYNNTDNDGDTLVNDGCPEINAETGGQCNNATNDDASNDALVNDGCPTPSECTPLGAASPIYCGDGRAGPAPPDSNRFAAPEDAPWPILVAGSFTPGTKQITVGGCFPNLGGAAFGPNTYANGFIDLRTGSGQMDLYGHINNLADCMNGLPFPSQGPLLNLLGTQIDFVEIGNKAAQHDSDSDGCSDTEELVPTAGSEFFGGRRDPFNRYDVYDPISDGTIDLFNDIFGVAFLYGLNVGDVGYDADFDRAPPIPGGNTWNLPIGDGTIDLFNDIFGVAFQYGLDCTL